jgi:hypothetical protein
MDDAAPLEVHVIFEQDLRKTDLLIIVHDMEAKLGKQINREARILKQAILELLPAPDL